MSLYIASVAALVAVVIAQSITHYFFAKSLQQTVERLTDRVMAKDYKEYRIMSEPTPEEPKTRKPLSAFDDPFLPGDEDEENYS